MLPSAIAKTERKEKFGVLLREHRLGRPRRLRCIGMTSPLGCGFKVPKRFGGLRGTLIESKQRTRNFDSENRPPALRLLRATGDPRISTASIYHHALVRSGTTFAKVRQSAILSAISRATLS